MIPLDCAVGVEPVLMQQIVRVESSGNPYAIGVVAGRLERQPRNLDEAVATVASLLAAGWNFSVGVSQVNVQHFKRLGWDSDIRKGFEPCANLRAGAGILVECYERAVKAGYSTAATAGYSATHAATSCYYAGSFTRGAQLGYVAKVLGKSAATQHLSKTAVSMMLD